MYTKNSLMNNTIRLPLSTSTVILLNKIQVITAKKSLLGFGISTTQRAEGLLLDNIRKRTSTICLDLSSKGSNSRMTLQMSGYQNTNDTMTNMSASACTTPSSSASLSSIATVILLFEQQEQDSCQ